MEDWLRIREILHNALAKEPAERFEFVADVCGDDEALRHEIESLLRCEDEASVAGFMEAPLHAQSYGRSTDRLDSQSDAADEDVPSQVDRYQIQSKLGSGAFGSVFLAHDPKLDRPVAIKVQRHPTKSDSDYDREGRILAQLDHPNIVPVYDTGKLGDGRSYVVSKFVEGTDLSKKIRQQRLNVTEAVSITAKIAIALQHSHQKKLIHRDVKPANILLDSNGIPYLADFGLTLSDDEIGNFRSQGFTPAYASPEQAAGEGHRVNGQSDIFSLGVVFYELLTGERPFQGKTTTEILEQILTQSPRPPRQLDPNIPAELERICLKALARRTSDRFTTAHDMAEDLHHFLAAETDVVHSSTRLRTLHAHSPTRVTPKGLRSFDADDADFFLELLPGPSNRAGLPESVAFWKKRFEETNNDDVFSVGVIYGPSGCGKSSLVKAGLLPNLASHVLSVYVESNATETETHLLSKLMKLRPSVESKDNLVSFISALRQQDNQTAGTKTLIVVDQFEQWLHTHSDPENSTLVKALRQCDGHRVQCLLLVRDDFWMAITDFMRLLDVRLIEEHNSQAVDCFRINHARKVLTEFGRAYGDLPETDDCISEKHKLFLDLALQQLEEDGKYVCVRLALFAQMMHGKAWTPEELQNLGGASGIGVTFLEETFSKPSSPAAYRVHDEAVRRIMKALLPDPGSPIKGQQISRNELCIRSGYQQRPDRFDDLMQLLDSQLRLVTPASSSGGTSDTDSDRFEAQNYQLTHDYLVPSIREWLNRKQKETWRGRAELCLEERAAQFKHSSETRYLPSFLEYLAIQFGVSRKRRSADERKVLSAASRRYGVFAAFTSIAVIACWFAIRDLNGRAQASRVVDSILVAETTELPTQIEKLSPYRRWADTNLKRIANDVSAEPRVRLRASLALASVDKSQTRYLLDRLADCSLDELPIIIDSVRPHSATIIESLWSQFDDAAAAPQWRLHAAFALASFEPGSDAWQAANTEFIVQELLAAEPNAQQKIAPMLAPIAQYLLPHLRKAFADPSEMHQVSSASLLNLLGPNDTNIVAELSSAATPLQFSLLFPTLSKLKQEDGSLLQHLISVVQQQPTSGLTESERITIGKRRANAAVSLLRLGERESVLKVFDVQEDPEAMTQFIHSVKSRRVQATDLIDLLRAAEQQGLTTARYAILLALGDYTLDDIPEDRSGDFISKLVADYERDPSSAIHGAAGWLLRQWNHEDKVLNVDQTPLPYDATGQREWFVEQIGEDHFTFIVFQPGVFMMGSAAGEIGRRKIEIDQHRHEITRTIAVSDREITRAQFTRQLPIDKRAPFLFPLQNLCPTGEHSMPRITWNQAVSYCLWLTSRLDGFSPDNMCYVESSGGLAFHPERRGIRLPSEAEWEYVCRSGTNTPYSFGSDRRLLKEYGWFLENAVDESTLVGRQLRPNLRGVFDVHGNVFEWCQDSSSSQMRILKGGGWYAQGLRNRCANRVEDGTNKLSAQYGFRIVRTISVQSDVD
ncbi:MAG: protein kinase [Planctomycetales bacterium]|nr:protein kinase [Planctomycetales bacterium]